MRAERWFGLLFLELCVGSSGSGGAPSGGSAGQDIYQRLRRSTRGSARSVMELSCLFNPRHMRVTRANPVGRQKPCCVFVEQLLGSWCTAVAGLVWKWRVTWSFNLFFFLLLLLFFRPSPDCIADNNCFWRVPSSEIEMRILNWGVEFMKILSICKKCHFCFVFFNKLVLASFVSFKIKDATVPRLRVQFS